MKKLFLIASALSIFLISEEGCKSSRAVKAGKFSDLSENFKNIKTYGWTSTIDQIPDNQVFVGPNGVLIYNNESGRKMIKDAIAYEFNAKGYKYDPTNPDIYVNYYILEQADSLRTANGYVTVSSGEKVRTDNNVSMTYALPGTLIINFIDAKTGVEVWQGFASGLLKPDMMADETKVRAAVDDVFQQFKYDNLSFAGAGRK